MFGVDFFELLGEEGRIWRQSFTLATISDLDELGGHDDADGGHVLELSLHDVEMLVESPGRIILPRDIKRKDIFPRHEKCSLFSPV